MLDGCALGRLHSTEQEADTNYLYGVTQPIYFIADSNAESGTVKIRAGLIPEIIAGSMTSSNNNKNETTNNKKTAKRYDIIINRTETPALINANTSSNTSLQTNLANEFCYLGDYYISNYGVGDVVVGECEGEIVVCATLDPQTLQEQSFVKLRREQDYVWQDKEGIPHTSNTGNACLYEPPVVGRLDLGKSYVFEIIGNYAASTDPYYLLDDAIIEACLDKSDPNNPQWNFNIVNLRIPVFADTCSLPDNYVDLIDGDITREEVRNRVPHCEFYKGAVEVLDYFEIGPYYQPGVNPPYAIVFSAGVDAHENEHYNQTIREVIRYFNENEIFRDIRNTYRLPKNETYHCPESAVAFVESLFKKELRKAIIEGSNLYERMDFDEENNEYFAELRADDAAQGTYTTIKQTFKTVGTYLHCK